MLKTTLINQHEAVLFPLKIWLVGAIGVRWAVPHISSTRSSLHASQFSSHIWREDIQLQAKKIK